MIAVRAEMDAATQAAQAELRLSLRRTIRAVRIYIRGRVGLVHKPIECLAVMHTRVGHVVLPDQLVLGIRIHVVLVAVEALAVLLGPARILVLLPVFRRVLLPSLRRLAGFHVLILVAAVTLLGNRHDRGINHLPAARNVALRLQMLAKAREQLLNQTGLCKCLPEQPQRRAVRNAILDAKPQEPRERQSVAHLILDLFVGQIVKRLQHQHPKHHHDVDRLAASAALLLAHRRQHRRLDLRAKTLERHHASNHFQRIALCGNRRKPPVSIEESKLPHRPHTRESCCHKSDSHKFAEVAIFRGALEQIAAGEQPSNASMTFFRWAQKAGQVFRYEIYNREGYSQLVSEYGVKQVDVSKFSADAVRSLAINAPIVDVREGASADRRSFFAQAYVPVLVNGNAVAIVAAYVDQTEKRDSFYSTFLIAGALLCLLTAVSFSFPAIAWYRRTKEKQQADRRIRFLAHHDALTGLVNRARLIEKLDGALAALPSEKNCFA